MSSPLHVRKQETAILLCRADASNTHEYFSSDCTGVVYGSLDELVDVGWASTDCAILDPNVTLSGQHMWAIGTVRTLGNQGFPIGAVLLNDQEWRSLAEAAQGGRFPLF